MWESEWPDSTWVCLAGLLCLQEVTLPFVVMPDPAPAPHDLGWGLRELRACWTGQLSLCPPGPWERSKGTQRLLPTLEGLCIRELASHPGQYE